MWGGSRKINMTRLQSQSQSLMDIAFGFSLANFPNLESIGKIDNLHISFVRLSFCTLTANLMRLPGCILRVRRGKRSKMFIVHTLVTSLPRKVTRIT